MKNSWNDANAKLIRIEDHPFFKSNVQAQVDVTLGSDIVFAGSCDISGFREERYWHELMCEQLNLEPQACHYVGKAVCTLPSLVRRLYILLKQCKSKPKTIFLVAPVSTPEHIIDGVCYSINRRAKSMEFLYRTGLVPVISIPKTVALQQAYAASASREQDVYSFCHDFSFLEILCNAYGVQLHWTFNRTFNSSLFYKDYQEFIDSHDWAKHTFAGHNTAYNHDAKYDAPTAESHIEIANLFLSKI